MASSQIRWPRWAKIAVPATAALIALSGCGTGGSQAPKSREAVNPAPIVSPTPVTTQPITAPTEPIVSSPEPTRTATAPATKTQAPVRPPAPTETQPAPADGEVYYANCAAAKAAGAAPLQQGDPGYRSGLDRDDDGVACES